MLALWADAVGWLERIRRELRACVARELALATRDELEALRERLEVLEGREREGGEAREATRAERLPPRLRESLGQASAAIAGMTAPRRGRSAGNTARGPEQQ